jgi:hypothetical protein
MEAYGGSGGISPPFLTSTLYGGEWSASRLCRFTPREIDPGTHWVGGWVGPRVGLDAAEKRKTLTPDGNPTLAVQLLLRRCTEISWLQIFMVVSCM